jgi:hypothetical protein
MSKKKLNMFAGLAKMTPGERHDHEHVRRKLDEII